MEIRRATTREEEDAKSPLAERGGAFVAVGSALSLRRGRAAREQGWEAKQGREERSWAGKRRGREDLWARKRKYPKDSLT
jgi:hypothetical protein